MNNKRIFSLILSIIMLLQVFVMPVEASGNNQGINQTQRIQRSDGVFVKKNVQAFSFENPEATQSRSNFGFFSSRTNKNELSLRIQRAGQPISGATREEEAIIAINAKGLKNGNSNAFDWAAFGDSRSFKAWVEVRYVGEVGSSRATEDITINSTAARTVTLKTDSAREVEAYELYSEYQDDENKVKVRAYFVSKTSKSSGHPLKFTFDIQELVNTKIHYEYVDEYGDEATDNKPSQAQLDATNIKTSLGETETPIKAEGEDNIRTNPNVDDDDFTDAKIEFKLVPDNTKEITINNIKYLVKGAYDYKTGAKVTLQRQLEVVTPKNPSKPIPAGYGRIELNADEKTETGKETAKGTFDQNYLDQNKRVVDVRAGLAYNTAADKIKDIGNPFPLNKEGKLDDGRKFKAWEPTLDSFGSELAKDKEVKTMYATYQSTADEIIPYLPTDEEPKIGSDDLPIPKDYVTVTFKSEDVKKGKVKIGTGNEAKEGVEVKAKVKPNLDLSKSTAITTTPADKYGFTEWKPALTKAVAGQTYTAYFIKSGDVITPGQVTPKGWFTVTVKQDAESIKANIVEEKSYSVAPN